MFEGLRKWVGELGKFSEGVSVVRKVSSSEHGVGTTTTQRKGSAKETIKYILSKFNRR